MRAFSPIAAVLLVAGLASALELPHVKTIRMGRHQSFDRLVIELDGEAPARVYEGPGGAFVLELAARPVQPRQTLSTALARTGRIEIQDTGEGLVLRVEARPRRARAFLLSNPDRVVIDFADPGDGAFEVPAGTREITSAPLIDASEAPSPPVPEPAAEVVPEPAVEVVPEPAAEVVPEPAAEVVPEPAAEVVPEPAAEVVPEPAAEVIPEPEAQVVAQPPRAADGLLGLPAWVTPPWLAGAALGGVVAVLGLWWLVRRAPDRNGSPAESTAPEDIESLSRDRMDLIVQRMDDEVRARSDLELQVGELREELKVVRDQTRRIKRHGEVAE